MGFEIVFHYHPKKDKQYDTEDKKFFKKKIGTEAEDTPVKDLAAVIKSELARRDIFIYDCEIYEYIKKKIIFRETKSGFIIKNNKFTFTGIEDTVVNITNLPEEQKSVILPLNNIMVKKEVTSSPARPGFTECKKYEYYNGSFVPPPITLTEGKKYLIEQESTDGMKCVLKDDRDVYVVVPFNSFDTNVVTSTAAEASQIQLRRR